MDGGLSVRPSESTVPSQAGAGADSARCVPRTLIARPPSTPQLEFAGCASTPERTSQSCTREVAPSAEKFQSSGQPSAPFARGEIEPRSTNEFFGSREGEDPSSPAAAGDAAKEISVGAKSSPRRETLALTGPIRNAAGSDFEFSVAPALAIAPC